MRRVTVQSCIALETNKALENPCIDEGVTKLALVSTRINEFIERWDITDTIKKARKIRTGRRMDI